MGKRIILNSSTGSKIDPMTHDNAVQKLVELLQQLTHGHTAVRCMELQFSRMVPPHHPDPEAMEELVWFVLGQGVKTFSLPSGDVMIVYANDFKPSQMEQFLGHLPFDSEDFLVTHTTELEINKLIARLQTITSGA